MPFTTIKSFALAGAVCFLANCSTTPEQTSLPLSASTDSPLLKSRHIPLIPLARPYTGENAAIVKHLIRGSVAQKSGFQVEDEFLKLNGREIRTAREFEQKIKGAPAQSTIEFRRRGVKHVTHVHLKDEKPRFGAGFEPSGIALVKNSSPAVVYMHQRELTVFAELSKTDMKNEIHVNLILDSLVAKPMAHLRLSLLESHGKKPLAQSEDMIDALGAGSKIYSKTFVSDHDLQLPLRLVADVDAQHFLFEFQ